MVRNINYKAKCTGNQCESVQILCAAFENYQKAYQTLNDDNEQSQSISTTNNEKSPSTQSLNSKHPRFYFENIRNNPSKFYKAIRKNTNTNENYNNKQYSLPPITIQNNNMQYRIPNNNNNNTQNIFNSRYNTQYEDAPIYIHNPVNIDDDNIETLTPGFEGMLNNFISFKLK